MKQELHLTYTGHSTVLLEVDGVRLLTDPLLRRRVAHLGRIVEAPNVSDWHIDAVLISHLHYDHLDFPSLRLLGRHTRLIVPRGTRSFLRRRGFRNVTEMKRYDQVRIGGVTITATPANHAGGRPFIGPSAQSLGYLIRGSYEIYFAGDTDLFPEMAELGENLDVALLPVWGYGPTLGPGHLDPFRAAQSLLHLAPRVAVPIHWGTYAPLGMKWLRPHFLGRPPRLFARHAEKLAPDVDVRILRPGESAPVELPPII